MLRRYVISCFVLIASLLAISAFMRWLEGTLDFKSLIVPVARIFLDVFNSPIVAILLCLSMAISGLVLFLFYWLWRIKPAADQLKYISAQIRSIPEIGNWEAFARTDAILKRSALVSRAWSLFKGTLKERSDGRIVTSVEPRRYFDLDALSDAGVRLRFFLGLPNDYVGVGLIFTFSGLVAGLYFASRSMMSHDLSTSREALVLLLHAATFKFLTSITGIFMSITLSWGQRIIVDSLWRELSDLQSAVEGRFPTGDLQFVEGAPSSNLVRPEAQGKNG